MRRLRSLWGGGPWLCLSLVLGLAGCASGPRRLTLGPGGEPGSQASRAAPTPPCGCNPVPLPPPTPAHPGGDPALASRSSSASGATPRVLSRPSRYFPALDEPNAASLDPLEPVPPDPLGVRTTLRDESDHDRGASVPRDAAMFLTAAANVEGESESAANVRGEPETPLNVTVRASRVDPTSTATPREPLPVAAAMTAEPTHEPGPSSSPPDATPAAPEPEPGPGRGMAIGLEYVEDPAPAGRPRLAHDGTLMPRPHPRPRARPRPDADPVRYGPDPTFPASYQVHGNAPTSVPKTREVWPTPPVPARPSLLSRLFQRFRKADGSSGQAQRPPMPAPAPAPALDPTMRPLPMPLSLSGAIRDGVD